MRTPEDFVPDIALRLVEDTDYDALFAFQRDPVAVQMAPFTTRDPSDRPAFDAHLNRLRVDRSVVLRTITDDGLVVGSIVAWDTGHTPQLGVGIDPSRWGEGIGTTALIAFTALMKRRPLQATVAADNFAAIRVLEKAGFGRASSGRRFAAARNAEIDEHLYELGFFPAPTFIGSVIA
jgi:RimJ/RimL family protein N-acetyltransferase